MKGVGVGSRISENIRWSSSKWVHETAKIQTILESIKWGSYTSQGNAVSSTDFFKFKFHLLTYRQKIINDTSRWYCLIQPNIWWNWWSKRFQIFRCDVNVLLTSTFRLVQVINFRTLKLIHYFRITFVNSRMHLCALKQLDLRTVIYTWQNNIS